MGCCGTVVKYLLFIFNFVFVICGIALIAVGGALMADVADFSVVLDEIETSQEATQITLIVLGSIIFVIAFLGCCGAIRESKCMLITYGVCLLVIFIVQLVIGIYVIATVDENTIPDSLNKIFLKHNEESKKWFDSLQTGLQCCGVKGESDYGINGWPTPQSCCRYADCLSSQKFQQGCAEALKDFIVNSAAVLGGVAIGLSVVEVFGMIFAFQQARKANQYFS